MTNTSQTWMKSPESPRVLSKSFRDPKVNCQFELLCNQILMCAYFSPTPKGFCDPVPMFPFIYPSRSSPLYLCFIQYGQLPSSSLLNFLQQTCPLSSTLVHLSTQFIQSRSHISPVCFPNPCASSAAPP